MKVQRGTAAGAEIAAGPNQSLVSSILQSQDLAWFLPMVVIVGVQVLIWMILAGLGLAATPLFGLSGLLAYTFMAAVSLARYSVFVVRLIRSGEKHPIDRSLAVLRDNRGTIILAILAVQVISIQSASFQVLKATIPTILPFWLDPYLVRVDGWLFGQQPWLQAQAAFGWTMPFFDAAYFAWVPLQIVAFFSLLMLGPSRLKSQAIVSLLLIWLLLGLIAACLLSSAGPIFYDRLFGGHTFADLSLAGAPNASRDSANLWSSYLSGRMRIGSGISAMPSIHVGLTLWLALVLKRTFLAPIAWAYVPVIWFGSVLLGWHYFTDGLIGVLGVALIWKVTPKLLWRHQSRLGRRVAAIPG